MTALTSILFFLVIPACIGAVIARSGIVDKIKEEHFYAGAIIVFVILVIVAGIGG